MPQINKCARIFLEEIVRVNIKIRPTSIIKHLMKYVAYIMLCLSNFTLTNPYNNQKCYICDT